MILANEAVAALLAGRSREALYRVHERPDPQAVELLLAKLADLERADAAGARARSRRRRRPQLAGEIARARHRLRRRSPAAAREAFPALVLRALKQARYDPREPRPLGPREPAPTATSPRRSAATPTSSSTARCCASSASRDDPLPDDLARARRAHLGARARGGARSSTSPTRSASRGCSSDGSSSAAGRSRSRARSSALIGSGLFVRFGDVFEGFLPARRLPGDYFELNDARHGARGPPRRAARTASATRSRCASRRSSAPRARSSSRPSDGRSVVPGSLAARAPRCDNGQRM